MHLSTLASGIDIGQGINVGPEKFGKKNIVGPLINVGPGKFGKKNAQIVQTYVDNLKISVAHGKNSKI